MCYRRNLMVCTHCVFVAYSIQYVSYCGFDWLRLEGLPHKYLGAVSVTHTLKCGVSKGEAHCVGDYASTKKLWTIASTLPTCVRRGACCWWQCVALVLIEYV